MIVSQEGKHFTCITQADHARFAGEILSLWRTDGLPEHPRRKALLFATREHDNGWLEADAAPRVDLKTGVPLGFRHMPVAELLEVWERCVDRHLTGEPEAAILIVQHSIELHRAKLGFPGWEGFLQRMEVLRDELLEVLDRSAESLDEDYRWLGLSDEISLAICERRLPATIDRWGTEVKVSTVGEILTLKPFPFAGRTTFRLPCRRIRAVSYPSDAALGSRLAEAKWEYRSISVAAHAQGA